MIQWKSYDCFLLFSELLRFTKYLVKSYSINSFASFDALFMCRLIVEIIPDFHCLEKHVISYVWLFGSFFNLCLPGLTNWQ